jgi:amidase
MAIGGDNGGSIRIPASWCGIYGLKPTWGLVPYTGAFAMNPQIDHLGPMTASMVDLEVFLGVLAGPDPLDPRQAAGLTLGEPCFDDVHGLRVGVLREGFGWPDVSEPEVDEAVEDAARSFAHLGADVRDVSNPLHRRGGGGTGLAEIGRLVFDDDGIGGPFLGYTSVTMTDYFHDAWRSRADQLPLTGKLTLVASHYLFGQPIQPQLARAHNLTLVQRRSYDDLLRDVDVLVMPTTPCRALPLPTHELTPVEELTLAFSAQSRNTGAFNSGGHPALSVPCAVVDGLPVGMMLVGRRGDDATVVRAGRLFADEVYTPDPPPVH